MAVPVAVRGLGRGRGQGKPKWAMLCRAPALPGSARPVLAGTGRLLGRPAPSEDNAPSSLPLTMAWQQRRRTRVAGRAATVVRGSLSAARPAGPIGLEGRLSGRGPRAAAWGPQVTRAGGSSAVPQKKA